MEKEAGANHILDIEKGDHGWLYKANEVFIACGIYESKLTNLDVLYATSLPYIEVPNSSFS
jgi:hypothetical protein